MRVCLRTSDGRIVASQSDDTSPLEPLIAEAVAYGYADGEIDASVMDDGEFYARLAAQNVADIPPPPEPTLAELLSELDDLRTRILARLDQ